MSKKRRPGFWENFKHFFLRGLGILLPSILTIWILIAAYRFVQVNIAEPINIGIKESIIQFYPSWPPVTEQDLSNVDEDIQRGQLKDHERAIYRPAKDTNNVERMTSAKTLIARRRNLDDWWSSFSPAMDLIGLVVAIVVIYLLGGILGSFLGRRIYRKGEELVSRLPLVSKVYPSVKQVTDFLVGGGDREEERKKFSRVVAVQYPRKGLWSVGLVTGETLRLIQDQAETECVTVFVPSSPTPFTGYVITVPVTDSIDLPITIEEALRFTISGGVLVPKGQQITPMDDSDASRGHQPPPKLP